MAGLLLQEVALGEREFRQISDLVYEHCGINLHEGKRAAPWAVTDAPADFVAAHLKGIVGFAMPIARLEGKWKMSQNRPAADHPGIVEGLKRDDYGAVADLVAERTR